MKMIVLDNTTYNVLVPDAVPVGVVIKGFRKYKDDFEVKGKFLIEAGASPENIDEDFWYFFHKKTVQKV